ncbi:carboxymuconolactone decarboxylase family protein [Micromonospora sp. WMMD961]|uniref:carboxymuconolactone decarboxylase family protein n=1 Tax=Micromonospora sp. WMMD961 TaxID=3016100 RepID=UPI0024172F7E|nr:carboxymuconolactone decarboxylase family protein [Micromonospora sp. WMMD961]MDG4780773.1 carboxymuconolactone decarboxylase family protein [Micromonospora sp. WMMD961]
MDARIQNVRLNAASNEQLMALADAGAAAFDHTATLQVEPALAQLLRLRVAQINNCSYCLLVHHAAARTADIPPAKVETLTAWWETHLFTEKERAALAYTEALTRTADNTVNDRVQEAHDKMTMHFTEAEILEIVAIVINMNIWTRLKLAEGAMPGT